MQQECEIQFVNPPTFDCECPVCLRSFKELNEVCQATCCGNHTCQECTDELKELHAICPKCRSNDFDAISDKFFIRLFLNLEVRCYHSNAGCMWTGELRQLDEHIEKNCKGGYVQCPCCSKPCHIDDHLPICPEAISCPNRCPNPFQSKDAIKAHIENECPLRVIMPPNGALPIAADGIVRVAPVTFTMADYLKHLENGQPWCSPPFYTRERGGYKLHIRINTSPSEERNHLSVHACVLKGEYDHLLHWPLHAEVEISLLSCQDNGNNVTKNLYLPGDEYCKQVPVDRVALQYKAATTFPLIKDDANAQYLFYGSLSFRIERVTILPTSSVIPIWAKNNSICYFTLNSFKKIKKGECDEFFGPSFYTHENGYKIELSVRLLPNGKTGTNVHVTAKVQETEHDNNLIFLFNGEIGVELINFISNRDHKRITITFENNQCESSAHGIFAFSKHSQLTYNSSRDTEYLRNDCLVFKVFYAVAYSTPCSINVPIWRQHQAHSHAALEFTLNKFSTRKSHQNVYYSQPLFASGYKIQTCVKANVNGYVSVYAYVMKGPNDDILIWPFRGDVVVELINWIEDNDHHRRVIELSPEEVTNNACDRVLVGDRSAGWGFSQFIQHSAIKAELLQDDCLYFRIKEVVVHSNELSLKRPIWQNSLSPFIEFTVTNNSKRREYNTTFYSPAFHSHNGGYKLRLEVKISDQQHIGIYAALLKGQHDDNLVWPFQASIVVELVNWRQDSNHHSYTISFNEHTPIQCKSRVIEGEKVPNGWGTNTFISYSFLDNRNSEYLQNDCLRFRVKNIDMQKPLWLKEAAKIFAITCFSDRIRLEKDCWSPPFYTSARGYRIRIKVSPAGAGTGKGTHVSIFGFLMKGDYDDELNWPFAADIVLDILNWSEDKNHRRVVIKFNDDSAEITRAKVSGNNTVASNGWGNEKAIELSAVLRCTPQYLLCDCMCIKIHDIVIYNACTDLINKKPYWEGWWNGPSALQPEFTITEVSQRMKYNSPYISPPFYTHRMGYKLRLEVYPNGLCQGAGTHVSVFVRLLKGENDQDLAWPMVLLLFIKLINWCKNDSHILKWIDIASTLNNDCMPVTGTNTKAKFARGLTMFCAHSALLASYKTTQYVQDDCMRVRVEKMVVPIAKLTTPYQPVNSTVLSEIQNCNTSNNHEHS